jgi:hypothetical protein
MSLDGLIGQCHWRQVSLDLNIQWLAKVTQGQRPCLIRQSMGEGQEIFSHFFSHIPA